MTESGNDIAPDEVYEGDPDPDVPRVNEDGTQDSSLGEDNDDGTELH